MARFEVMSHQSGSLMFLRKEGDPSSKSLHEVGPKLGPRSNGGSHGCSTRNRNHVSII